MAEGIINDLSEVVKTLARYVENGFTIQSLEQKRESLVLSKPDASKFTPLKRLDSYSEKLVAVDCSTRTLKRAHNWGIFMLRTAHALVENREVDWGYKEKLTVLIGPSYVRCNTLRNLRLEVESEAALDLSERLDSNDYILLDGASYFGEKKGFQVSLYEKCKKKDVYLLAFSKQSPTLHDEYGRDFQAAVQLIAPRSLWVYHPVRKANLNEHLYGDISIVKLCEESPRVFRCDIMKYLTDRKIAKMLSPLTAVSKDPRCLGYPVPLWLAHEFSTTSDSKLLYYHELVEASLKEAGIYDKLSREELACNFADELHSIRYPFEREVIEYV
ncbi:MAG: DNA double-strand break repair nuclease NurA [Candidatus Bathyarchaeia archaeon]|nr:DNA double-strand break repair nuclease NurA [Candidatus Bathyarchaeia archaeon]